MGREWSGARGWGGEWGGKKGQGKGGDMKCEVVGGSGVRGGGEVMVGKGKGQGNVRGCLENEQKGGGGGGVVIRRKRAKYLQLRVVEGWSGEAC